MKVPSIPPLLLGSIEFDRIKEALDFVGCTQPRENIWVLIVMLQATKMKTIQHWKWIIYIYYFTTYHWVSPNLVFNISGALLLILEFLYFSPLFHSREEFSSIPRSWVVRDQMMKQMLWHLINYTPQNRGMISSAHS